jgi:hypothetical protein
MKRNTNYPNAMILFALAFVLALLLAAPASPVAAQHPPSQQPPLSDSVEGGIPPQVNQLIDLLDDPAVRTWMDQQRSARNPPQTSPAEPRQPQATLSTFTASRLALIRQHLQTLAAALPNLPGELRQAASVLLQDLQNRDPIVSSSCSPPASRCLGSASNGCSGTPPRVSAPACATANWNPSPSACAA